MSKAPRKLTLTRETLLPLQNNELTEVHGGTSPVVSVAARVAFIATVRFCPAVSAFTANQAQHSFPAVGAAKKIGAAIANDPKVQKVANVLAHDDTVGVAKKVGGWIEHNIF